jgi:tetratricopeptide (TPR) repeat protein
MKEEVKQKRQQPIFIYLIIFVVGFVSGVGFSAYKLEPGSPTVAGDGQTQKEQEAQTAEAIRSLEADVTADPENFKAWVQLGHLYFDSKQHQKAITAYETSLKYHSGDANLLTDLGVMYRRTDRPEQAIEWFEKAQAMDPTHQPSRFNEGIVRYYDLGDTPGAIAGWEELLRINPDAAAGNGTKIREIVDGIKAEYESQQNQQ